MRRVTALRRSLKAIWLCLIAVVAAVIVFGHLAPVLGYQQVIVKGPSMSPAIAVGALILEQPVPEADLRPGDVVTFALPNGAVVTHRIVRLATVDGTLQVETKGDANASSDPTLHPASGISGVVRVSLPLAGFLFAYLTLPTGIISVFAMLGCLLVSIWLLDDLETEQRDGSQVEDARPPVPDALTA